MFRDIKINVKIILAATIVIITAVAVGYVSITTFRNVGEINEELQTDIVPGAIIMTEMEGCTINIHSSVVEYLITADIEEKEELQELMNCLRMKGAEHLEHETHIGLEEQKTSEELNTKIENFNIEAQLLIDQKDEGIATEILIEEKEGNFHSYYDVLLVQLRKHKAIHLQELEDANETVIQAHASGTRNILIIVVVMMISAIVSSFLISRAITKPIKELFHGIKIVEKGDLDHKVGTDTKDEIGQLAQSFNKMTVAIKESRAEVDKRVKEQTQEIIEQQKKTEETMQNLEKTNKAMTGRELKMIELKKEIQKLKGQDQ